MELEVFEDSLQDLGFSTMGVNINNLTYSMVIDDIYINKLSSVIRELCTNARDSHIEASNHNPFDINITLEDTGYITLSVKDYGTGLSEKEASKLLCSLNSSSKRDDNTQIGCFGIGSKSPFSLSNTFDFKCIKDGVQTNINLFRVKSETPKFIINTEPSNQPNGVECILTFKSNIKKVLESISSELCLFDIKPNLNISMYNDSAIQIQPEDFFLDVTEYENLYKIQNNKDIPEYITDYFSTHNLDYDEILYMNFKSIKNHKNISIDIISYSYKDLFNANRMMMVSYTSQPEHFILKFDNTSNLSFDISRENIVNNESNMKIIGQKLDLFLNLVNIKEIKKLLISFDLLNSSYSLFALNRFDNIDILELFNSSILLPDDTTVDIPLLLQSVKEGLHYLSDNLEKICYIKLFSNLNSSSFLEHINSVRTSVINGNSFTKHEYLILNNSQLFQWHIVPSYAVFNNTFSALSQEYSCFKTENMSLYLSNLLKNIILNINSEIKLKSFYLQSGIMDDPFNVEICILLDNKRLNQSDGVISQQAKNFIPDNKVYLILRTTKTSIDTFQLKSNIQNLISVLNDDIKVFSFEDFNIINENFINNIKYKAPPRIISRTPTNSCDEISIFEDSNDIKTRNKIQVFKRSRLELVEDLDLTTSIKLYRFFKTLNGTIKTSYLISSSIVSNEDELNLFMQAALTILQLYSSDVTFIFEIDNSDFNEITQIAKNIINTQDYHNSNIVLLNDHFQNSENLVPYKEFIIDSCLKDQYLNNFIQYILNLESPEDQIFKVSNKDSVYFLTLYQRTMLQKLKSTFNFIPYDFMNYLTLLPAANISFLLENILLNTPKKTYQYPSTKNIKIFDFLLSFNNYYFYKKLFNTEYIEELLLDLKFDILEIDADNLTNILSRL